MSAIFFLIAILAAGHTEASEACERKLDLAIVADGSWTICNGSESCSKWDSVLQFSKDFVRSFKIGPDDTKVAFATIADKVHTEWNFNAHTDEPSLLSAIDNVKYPGGEFQYLGIPSTTILITELFNSEDGARWDAPNIAMLITDGAPNVDYATASLVSAGYQVVRIAVFTVCDQPGCKEIWAQGISSQPKKANETYFLAEDYFSLAPVMKNLVEQICSYKMPPMLPLPPGK